MQIVGLIEQYNTERPNQVEDSLKMEMLKKCEEMIIDIIIRKHENAPSEEELTEHIDTFGFDTEAYVPSPFDDLYLYYLDQRIALNNNDMKRFNIARELYNNALIAYQQKYNRDEKAIQASKKLLRHEVL